MKTKKILYWVFTGLFAFMMLGSAIPDILVAPIAVEGFRQMQLPAYLIPFLGVAKALGVIAILIPGYPRVKEWAYAGLTIDLVGATYAIISSGHPVSSWITMILPLTLAIASYVFYHKKLKAALPVNKTGAEEKPINSIVPGVNKDAHDTITAIA